MTHHQPHGSSAIKDWLHDLIRVARSDTNIETSAGAEPGREYAYLEFHHSEDRHSILLFRVENAEGGRELRTYRFDGSGPEVRDRVDALTHDR